MRSKGTEYIEWAAMPLGWSAVAGALLCFGLAFLSLKASGQTVVGQVGAQDTEPLGKGAEIPGASVRPAAPSTITLDVVARDHGGAPVSGLTQADFTLLDGGRPGAIESFKALTGMASGQAAAAPPVRVILLVDMVNTNFSNVAYERSEIDRFLRKEGGQLAEPTSLMLFTDTSVETMVDSSTDGTMLAQKLDGNDSALREIRRSAGFYGAVERFQLSVSTLLRIAAAEKGQPGRKLLVWLSPGWPLLSGPGVQLTTREQEGLFRTIVAVSAALREARITLYSIDPLGTADAGTLRTVYYKTFLKGVTEPKHVDAGDLGLEVLAVQSGGRALSSNNNLSGLIDECYRDARAYYELTFRPSPAEHADEYRSIAVRTERPQVTTQTRTGYYMQP